MRTNSVFRHFAKMMLFAFIAIACTSCKQTGTFTITDANNDDPSLSQKEINKGRTEMIGKEIYIEKVGDYLKVQLEGEPDVFLFEKHSEYNGTTEYIHDTGHGEIHLQFNHLFDNFGLRYVTVTSGRMYAHENGHTVEIKFD